MLQQRFGALRGVILSTIHDPVRLALPAMFCGQYSLIAYRHPSFLMPYYGRNIYLHMVGKFLRFLALSTSSLLDDSQLPVACCN